MSSIAVAAILIGIIAGICFMLVRIHNKQKIKATNELLQKFSQLGSEHQLKFSSQEVLTGSMIGVDGINRKILVLTMLGERLFDSLVINLANIKGCSVKKYYAIKTGRPPEKYLEKIVLSFESNGNGEPVEILFYKHFEHHVLDIPELERKAEHWKAILSKMLTPLTKTA